LVVSEKTATQGAGNRPGNAWVTRLRMHARITGLI